MFRFGGADCILCKSHVKDWTDVEMIERGFKIDRSAADMRNIFNSVVGKNGDIIIRPKEVRSGVTKESLSDSDQQSITITHTYINGTAWYLKLLYRCHADYKKWIEKAGQCDILYRSKDMLEQL